LGFSWQVYILWRLWNFQLLNQWNEDTESLGFLPDIVSHLIDLNVKLHGEKHTTFVLITIRPFQKRLDTIFKDDIQCELNLFRRLLGKIKAKAFQIYSVYWKVGCKLCGTIWWLFSSKTVAAASWKPFCGEKNLPNSRLTQKTHANVWTEPKFNCSYLNSSRT